MKNKGEETKYNYNENLMKHMNKMKVLTRIHLENQYCNEH